jgi:SPOR domain
MRTVAVLLLLANLALAGYIWLDSASGGEGVRLKQQVRPEAIKLLTPQEVAALGPAKAAALADVCLEWGPFGEADRGKALADLEPLALGKLLSQRRIEAAIAFWVYLPPAASKAAADKRASELRAAGVKDVFVVDGGTQRFALSLGVFRTEDAANAQLTELTKRGVVGAKAGPRQVPAQTVLVIRDPPQPVIARLRELAPAYPAAEVKIGGCDKPA